MQAQWERDRAKKAENKKRRAEERREAAKLGLSWNKHKRFKETAPALLLPATDINSIETLIREFLADIGGPNTLPLPPMKAEARKQVHTLASFFHLKSKS